MPESLAKRRVVVTGYGMVTPLGRDTEETFVRASRGESGIDAIHGFDTTGLPCRIGGEIDDSWIKEIDTPVARKLAKTSSRGVKLMLTATWEAARQARLDSIPDRTRIGVSLGSHGEDQSLDSVRMMHKFYDGSGRWDVGGLMRQGGYPYLHFLRRKPDVATAVVAAVFGCAGSNLSIVSACAAGAQAIGEAKRFIDEGKCDVMVCGGCEAPLSFLGFLGFVLIQALAVRYSNPKQASRPFDRKRSGFVMSEGAGALILEEREHAR